jgi:hypothetical protein
MCLSIRILAREERLRSLAVDDHNRRCRAVITIVKEASSQQRGADSAEKGPG